jgi:hypothetical protein
MKTARRQKVMQCTAKADAAVLLKDIDLDLSQSLNFANFEPSVLLKYLTYKAQTKWPRNVLMSFYRDVRWFPMI